MKTKTCAIMELEVRKVQEKEHAGIQKITKRKHDI